MKRLSVLITMILLFIIPVFSQDNGIEKIKKLKFCGYKIGDTAFIRQQYGPQLNFLQINDKDTVIDVGTSSGAYIGALNAIGAFKNVHFILVDIDSNCLNRVKVDNMINYYQGLRGTSFGNTFSIVVNTPDSLCLPLDRFKKLWIINTLHEIDDKGKMARQIAAVLRSGGEVIVAEMLATQKITRHGGCHKPLMSAEEIINLFAVHGFKLTEKENLQPVQKEKDKHPFYFFRLTKM